MLSLDICVLQQRQSRLRKLCFPSFLCIRSVIYLLVTGHISVGFLVVYLLSSELNQNGKTYQALLAVLL